MPKTTVESLIAQREAAGAAYVAATANLYEAFIELAALDQALSNSNVASQPLRSFNAPGTPVALHSEFLPTTPDNLVTQVRARLEKILSDFSR